MAKNLVIVESPAKAKTIGAFLGSDYEIKSSFGHIRDLPKKGLGVDIEKKFQPTYEVSPDKQKVAAELKKASKNKTVWLASDEDREGEAIAWHISNILGLDPKKTKRIVFHEITRPPSRLPLPNRGPSISSWSTLSRPDGYWIGWSAMNSVRFYGKRSGPAYRPAACKAWRCG